MQPQDPNAFLLGGGVPSASFLAIGDQVEGIISEPPTLSQQKSIDTGLPKTWEDGNPMMQLVVTLQTDQRSEEIDDDDGRRRIYVKFNLKNAVADAVRKAGAKSLEVGGRLKVQYVRNGEQTKKGFSPPKLYQASYVPPAAGFLAEPERAEPPQQHISPAPIAPPSWSWAQVLAEGVRVGMTEDSIKAALKAAGLTGYVPSRDTARVVALLAGAEREVSISF